MQFIAVQQKELIDGKGLDAQGAFDATQVIFQRVIDKWSWKFIKRGQALPVQVLPQFFFFELDFEEAPRHFLRALPHRHQNPLRTGRREQCKQRRRLALSTKSRVALVGVQRHEQELSGGGDCSSGGGQRQGAL